MLRKSTLVLAAAAVVGSAALSTSAFAFERDLSATGRGSSRLARHDGELEYRRYWPYHAYYDYCAAHAANSDNGC